MSDTAVLVIDILNDYRHPNAQQLAGNVAPIIDQLVELIANADDHHDAAPSTSTTNTATLPLTIAPSFRRRWTASAPTSLSHWCRPRLPDHYQSAP
jgi:nicotinamidase-related amidase